MYMYTLGVLNGTGIHWVCWKHKKLASIYTFNYHRGCIKIWHGARQVYYIKIWHGIFVCHVVTKIYMV